MGRGLLLLLPSSPLPQAQVPGLSWSYHIAMTAYLPEQHLVSFLDICEWHQGANALIQRQMNRPLHGKLEEKGRERKDDTHLEPSVTRVNSSISVQFTLLPHRSKADLAHLLNQRKAKVSTFLCVFLCVYMRARECRYIFVQMHVGKAAPVCGCTCEEARDESSASFCRHCSPCFLRQSLRVPSTAESEQAPLLK